MKKTIMAALAAMLLLPLGTNAQEEPQTLTIGDYDSATDGTGVYNASYNEMAPTTFYLCHTGSQIIYTKDDLAEMVGKDITSVNYIFYHMGSYDEITRDIKVYIQQIDAETFAKNDKNKYLFFDFSTDSLCVDTTFYEWFGIEDDYMNHELKLNLKTPYHYDGTKSLLVTITFDGDVATSGSDCAAFYTAGDGYTKRAMTFCDDNNTFADYMETEDWPVVTKATGTNVDLPLTQFTYVTPAAPEPEEVRALTIDEATMASGDYIVCSKSGAATVKASVKLTNAGNVDLTPGEEGYVIALTNEAADSVYATMAVSEALAAGETKTLDATFTVENAAALAQPVTFYVTDSISATKALLGTVTFAEPKAVATLLDAEKTALTSGTAIDFGTVTDENVTKSFYLTNDGNISMSLRSVEVPDGFSTTLKKSLVVAANDTVSFTVTANNYVAGEHSGNMTVSFYTDGVDDYTLALSSNVVEADTVLTLGNYNGNLADGVEDDTYQGSYFERCPTTFYLKHTGSQILYTKEQLARMADKGVKEMRYVFYNTSAYANYPRTVNVWMEETDATAFERDEQSSKYKFFDYTNATKVITDLELDIDFLEYAGISGEMVLPFDETVNYSGEKNLLVTITFDGDDTMSSMDLGFFYNKEVKNAAMTYTDDNYSFADLLETEDWPYETDATGTRLEQPVTRFIFGKKVITGIHNAQAADTVKTGATYNLAGQRVSDSYKGIVIRDGKKALRK